MIKVGSLVRYNETYKKLMVAYNIAKNDIDEVFTVVSIKKKKYEDSFDCTREPTTEKYVILSNNCEADIKWLTEVNETTNDNNKQNGVLINLDTFIDFNNKLKNFIELQNKLDAFLNILSDADNSQCNFGNTFIDAFIDAIEITLNAKDNWYSWFVFENDFGNDAKKVKIGDKYHIIKNETDFYNVCIVLYNKTYNK